MKDEYITTSRLIERLHRRFLDVIKAELDRLGIEDINNVQALILFNIGDETLTVGELTLRGYYLGSNVSYNVRKLVENGYLIQERSTHDRRMMRVRLSDKGFELVAKIDALYERSARELAETGLVAADLARANEVLRRLERFWSVQLSFIR